MALNDTTDRPVSRHGEYRTAEEIEKRNYTEQGKAVPSAEWTELDYYKITIAELISNEPSNDPYVLSRIRDLAKEKEMEDSETCPKGL